MTIGINAAKLLVQEKSGVEYVVSETIRALIEETAGSSTSLVLYSPERVPGVFPDHVKIRVLSWPFRFLWTQIRLGYALWSDMPDVFLDFSNGIPFLSMMSRTRHYYFLHDLSFYAYPRKYRLWDRSILRITNAFSFWKATCVFVPTDWVRQQVQMYIPRMLSKIHVVGLGVPAHFFTPPQPSRDEGEIVRALYNIDRPYILFLGRIDEKKNLDHLVLGFARWHRRNDFCLVLAGREGVFAERIKKMIHDGNNANIHMTGFVSEEAVRALYASCVGTVLLTYGEGYGLPIVESFLFGKPVLVSYDTGGVSDQLSDQLVFCNGNDPDDIARGLEQLVHHSTVHLPFPLQPYNKVCAAILDKIRFFS